VTQKAEIRGSWPPQIRARADLANPIQFISDSAPARGQGVGGYILGLKTENITPQGVALESVRRAVIPWEYRTEEGVASGLSPS
jgi:hypothetical protein